MSTTQIKKPRVIQGCSENANGRWVASITVNKRKIHLGTYETFGDANAAYQAAAKHYREKKPIAPTKPFSQTRIAKFKEMVSSEFAAK